MQPIGSSLGLLTGIGGTIEFIDQDKGDPKVHQYSVDVQRELRGELWRSRSATSAPPDATSATSAPTATTPAKRSTSTRSIRRWRARRSRGRTAPGTRRPCARRCPTRSSALRVPASSPRARPSSAGQLLRPFPQFGDVFMSETTEGGRRQYHAATFVLDKRDDRLVGRPLQLHVEPDQGQPVRGDQHLSRLEPQHRRTTTTWMPSTASATSTRRTGSSWRRSFGSRTRAAAMAPHDGCSAAGTLGDRRARQRRRRSTPCSAAGCPTRISDSSVAGSGPTSRAIRTSTAATRIGWRRPTTPTRRGSIAAAFTNPGAGQYGNAPRTIGDARYQFRKTIDLVLAKNTTFARTQSGEIRFEILNLTNTAKFRGEDSQLYRLVELRPHHATGRVHEDLAAGVPVSILIGPAVARVGKTRERRRVGSGLRPVGSGGLGGLGRAGRISRQVWRGPFRAASAGRAGRGAGTWSRDPLQS